MNAPTPPPASGPYATPEERAIFLYVKIPVSRRGTDPLHLREDQIDQALRAQGLGIVVGWGDSLGAARADGRRLVAHFRIDISTPSPDAARAALRDLLPALDTPSGTQIHYMLNGRHCMDLATDTGWQLAQNPPAPERPGGR